MTPKALAPCPGCCVNSTTALTAGSIKAASRQQCASATPFSPAASLPAILPATPLRVPQTQDRVLADTGGVAGVGSKVQGSAV